MRLKDKVVLVTASTRGIGLAITEKCAQEGARVYMAARDMAQAKQVAERLGNGGGKVCCVYNDASRPDTFRTMVAETVAHAGRVDVLVNNFGGSDPRMDRDIFHTEPEVFDETILRNIRSVFMGSQAALEVMTQQGSGSIVNISSVGGSVPDISQIGYGTSKAAIDYLTKLIALQAARYGVRCNAVAPGMTATESVQQHLADSFRERFVRHIPLGRMGLPEEIAAAVVYFASDESAYTTGQVVSVSGGFGLGTPLYADLAGSDHLR